MRLTPCAQRARAGVRSLWGVLAALPFFVAGCGPEREGRTPWEPTAFPAATEPDPDSVALGRMLFYDPILSGDGATACGTCHSEFWGMSDALDRSIGQGGGLLAGPGRDGPNVVRRNSQALWNLAFREDLLWDGRSTTLEEQALVPMFAPDELGRDPDEAVAEIAQIAEYRALFAAAFPDDPTVTVEHLTRALADFQRTFVSNDSLYDGYADGDDWAMSDEMVEGMWRFASFRCDGCHTPPLFESPGYFDRAVPEIEGLEDGGRYEATGIVDDIGRFRVPSLRNVAFTEPYFHNGSVAELEDAVRHELARSGRGFDEEDVRLVTIFVGEALRDESREPNRPDAVPSGMLMPIDGSQVVR